MRVSWKTNGKRPRSVHVSYSLDPLSVAWKIISPEHAVQYLAARGGYGWHHTAKLTGLQLGANYYYRIFADGVSSTERSFKTPDRGQSEATFLVTADMGYDKEGEATETRSLMENLKRDSNMVIHAGDIGYADDSMFRGLCAVEFCYEAVYDRWMTWMENITDHLPYMVAAGNHESECHSPACEVSSEIKRSLANFSAYNARWSMPSLESGGVGNMWYSFDYAGIHFVAINTETDFAGAGEENYGDAGGTFGQPAGHFGSDGEYERWLETDLKRASSMNPRPWIIAFGHRPWFTKDGVGRDNATKEAHASLFKKYGVDLYINGHVHSYHRLLPLRGNTETPTITVGGAGCDEFASDKKKSGEFDERGVNAAWDYRYYNVDKTVSQMKVTAEEIAFTTYASSSGEVIDSIKLSRTRNDQTYV